MFAQISKFVLILKFIPIWNLFQIEISFDFEICSVSINFKKNKKMQKK
jgi:hypothetical protein